MVVAADNVGNAHIVVVHHNAEVVGRRTVGAGDNQVVKCFIGDRDFAFDQVRPLGNAVQRRFETDNRLHVGRDFGKGFAFFGTPAAVVSRRAFFFGFLAHGFQLFFTAIAVVGGAFFQEFGDDFFIAVEAAGLVHNVVGVVVIETDPFHAVEDDVDGFGGGTRQVGVFDTQ